MRLSVPKASYSEFQEIYRNHFQGARFDTVLHLVGFPNFISAEFSLSRCKYSTVQYRLLLQFELIIARLQLL